MKNHSSFVMTGLMTTFVTAVANPAFAADGKLYSGYDCKESLGEATPATPAITYVWGTALNESDKPVGLHCSIIRDAVHINKGSIAIVDAHPKQDFECWLTVYARQWGRRKPDFIRRLQINMTQPAELPPGLYQDTTRRVEFGGLQATGGVSDVYFLDCTVPGKYKGERSGIVSYRVEEED